VPSSFSTLGVPDHLVTRLHELGIVEPYPIQFATIPGALRGDDVFAQSPTGSGKTLAFAIPLVARFEGTTPRRARALVLAPTRELAAQIAEAVRPLARAAHLRIAPFYGGTGYKTQLEALRRGVDVVVGCPGRLIDLLERGALDLSGVEAVVVDEADRMADMGFLPDVRRLLAEVQGERQTMLFSATLTKEVERLVRDYQRHPKRHVLERPSDDLGSRTHEFWRAAREERARLTIALVSSHSSSIVFCRTKHGADRLARQLGQAGVRAVAIHGNRSQAQRDRALEQFRDRRADVLVGTDVASRGLHIEGVECVVHYDPPEDAETYVHRSGRTGRAGASGRVVSLVCPDQERSSRLLASGLGLEASLGPPPQLTVPPRRADGVAAGGGNGAAGARRSGARNGAAATGNPESHRPHAEAGRPEEGRPQRNRRRVPAARSRSTSRSGKPDRKVRRGS
jgi:superfamily II DNA/RNA helicase